MEPHLVLTDKPVYNHRQILTRQANAIIDQQLAEHEISLPIDDNVIQHMIAAGFIPLSVQINQNPIQIMYAGWHEQELMLIPPGITMSISFDFSYVPETQTFWLVPTLPLKHYPDVETPVEATPPQSATATSWLRQMGISVKPIQVNGLRVTTIIDNDDSLVIITSADAVIDV